MESHLVSSSDDDEDEDADESELLYVSVCGETKDIMDE